MAAVLQQPEPAASQAGSTSNGGAGPYLNNAERVFDYTIDYEVRASRPLVMGSIADSSIYTYYLNPPNACAGRGQAAPGD